MPRNVAQRNLDAAHCQHGSRSGCMLGCNLATINRDGPIEQPRKSKEADR